MIRRMVTGIGPARQLVRHEREHRRIAHQPTYHQNEQNELVAAVASRVYEENAQHAALDTPVKPAHASTLNPVKSAHDKLKESATTILQGLHEKARAEVNADAKFLLMYRAWELDHAIVSSQELLIKSRLKAAEAPVTEADAHQVLDLYKKRIGDSIRALVACLDELKEAKAIAAAIRGVQAYCNLSDLERDLTAIENADDPESTLTDARTQQEEALVALQNMKSDSGQFYSHRDSFEIAAQTIHGRNMVCLGLSIGILKDNISRKIDKQLHEKKAWMETETAKASSSLSEAEKQAFRGIQQALELYQTWSTLRERLQIFPVAYALAGVMKQARDASAHTQAPSEQDGKDADTLLGNVLSTIGLADTTVSISKQHTAEMVRHLSTLCSLQEDQFFSDVMNSTVCGIKSEDALNAMQILSTTRPVEQDARDDVRKLLRIFELAYAAREPNTRRTSIITKQWFALSEHPITDYAQADLPKLRTAIWRMYEEAPVASALPPHFAYEFIHEVVAYPENVGKSGMQDLVDTANMLIGKENELTRNLRIEIDDIDLQHADLCSAIQHYLKEVSTADFNTFAGMLRDLKVWYYFEENTGTHKNEQPYLPLFSGCYDATTSLLEHLTKRMLVFDVDATVSQEHFRDALRNLAQIIHMVNVTKNFTPPKVPLFRFDDHCIGAADNLYFRWHDVEKWKRATPREISNYLQETISTLAPVNETAIFSATHNLQNISVKAAVFVLTELLSGDIHDIVYGVFEEAVKKIGKKVVVDKADVLKIRERARQISAILKLIDSALIARRVFDHADKIAAEWMRVAIYYKSIRYPVGPNDIKTFMQTTDNPLYFPPYKAYAILMAITTEEQSGISLKPEICDFCKKMAPEMLKHDKALLLKSEAGPTLKDEMSKQIVPSFGSTKRRKYAASPWTAV
jgi:hypothetical protein